MIDKNKSVASLSASTVELPDVQRYAESSGEGGGVYPSWNGDYVSFADYVALYEQMKHSTPALAARGVPVDFKEWFEREWAAYEDKAISGGKIVSMAWALKAWRNLSATQPASVDREASKPAAKAPTGWRIRIFDDGAAVVEKGGLGGVVCKSSDESIASAILRELVGDIIAASPAAPSVEQDERGAFEAWIRNCEGYPYAGQYANLMWKAWQARAKSTSTGAQDERGALAGRGVHALRYAIECLRESGWYRDEEGEDIEALDDLCKLLERTDDPATDAEEASALRAFDKSNINGHSHDLESYCAGHIDATIQARAASTSANVAQGAEPVAWICENSTIGPHEDKHTVDWYGEDIDALPVGTKLYAAPPAQTARPAVALDDELAAARASEDGK